MRKHGIFTEILKNTSSSSRICECPPAGLALVTLDTFTGLTVLFLCSVAAICLTTFKSETT